MFSVGRHILRNLSTRKRLRELFHQYKMDSDDDGKQEQRFEEYITWIKALRCEVSTGLLAEDLKDCVGLAEILHRIDGEFFSEDWVEKIFPCAGDSPWRLRANNLKKILSQVSEYMERFAGRSIKGHSYWVIDEQMFAEAGSLLQMNKVLTLIIAAACLGKYKKEFIQLTRDQSESVQTVVVQGLTDVQTNSDDVNLPAALQHTASSHISNGNHHMAEGEDPERVNQLARENEELRTSLHERELELESARQRLEELDQSPSIERLEAENNDLREKKSELDTRLIEVEMSLELMNNNLDKKEQEHELLKEKMNNIHVFEEKYNTMKDEVEELRAKELEQAKLVRENELLKQRTKETANLRSELNVLRDANARYVTELVSLEDEKNKNKSLRQQIGALKAQRDEKEREGEKLFVRLSKLESELGDTKSRLAIAEKKNEDHVFEKLQLKEKVTELEYGSVGLGDDLQSDLNESVNPDNSLEGNRVRILEQERELSQLRERVSELEQLEGEKREYETTKGRIRELESELQLAVAKRTELSETVERLEGELETKQFSGDNTELKVQLEQKSVEINKLKERLDSSERRSGQDEAAAKKFADVLAEKERQIEKQTEQLKKAKQLLIDQEQRLGCSEEGGLSRHEFDSLRREIEQKERTIRRLTEELEGSNRKHEEEQRLVTTAYYGMAQRLNESARHDVSDSARERSFLAKQKDTSRPNLRYS